MNSQIAKSNWSINILKFGVIILLVAVVLMPAPARADFKRGANSICSGKQRLYLPFATCCRQ